jgi:hypothetical protein
MRDDQRQRTMTLSTIPQSVLNLLAQRWPEDHDRRRPPRYLFRPDYSPGRVNGGRKHSEVRALVADGVLANDWRALGDAIAITANQQHALCDFLTDVYAAWDRLQARTDTARNTTEMRRVG